MIISHVSLFEYDKMAYSALIIKCYQSFFDLNLKTFVIKNNNKQLLTFASIHIRVYLSEEIILIDARFEDMYYILHFKKCKMKVAANLVIAFLPAPCPLPSPATQKINSYRKEFGARTANTSLENCFENIMAEKISELKYTFAMNMSDLKLLKRNDSICSLYRR